MLQITRVLHAHDFSPASRTALKFSKRISDALHVPLEVVHVTPSFGPVQFVEIEPYSADQWPPDSAERRLVEAVQAVGRPEQFRLLMGRGPLPGPAILELAAQAKPNLIVIGAQGVRAAEEGQLGSVASELIQRSACPVMLVPERVAEEAADDDVSRIVTYISFAHLVEPVMVFAFRIARVFGAHLDVLALTNGAMGRRGEVAGSIEHSPEAIQSVLHRQLLRAVERESAENGSPFEDVQIHLRSGHDADTILEFTRSQNSDLLVVEAPGLAAFESPWERMVEHIVNHAPCPVIVVNTCGQRNVGKRRTGRAAAVAAPSP